MAKTIYSDRVKSIGTVIEELLNNGFAIVYNSFDTALYHNGKEVAKVLNTTITDYLIDNHITYMMYLASYTKDVACGSRIRRENAINYKNEANRVLFNHAVRYLHNKIKLNN